MQFLLESFYNPHLAPDTRRLDAVLSISAQQEGSGIVASGSRKGVIFLIDVSTSMQGEKLDQAKKALSHCVDLLDDNTMLGVIAFAASAQLVAPLAAATKRYKGEVCNAINRLTANGSTVMSKAMALAAQEFSKNVGIMGFAQLLTDGRNGRDDTIPLQRSLEACRGRFQCDCWGIGTDWRPDELRRIASQLLGSADAIPSPQAMTALFKESLTRSLAKGVGNVKLRMTLPRSARIIGFKQLSPEIVDLAALRQKVDERTVELPLGAWGRESRDYHLILELEPLDPGEEMVACRTAIAHEGEDGTELVQPGSALPVTWSGDTALTKKINPQLAHYAAQEELSEAVQAGLQAKNSGDSEAATRLLGKAARLAQEHGNIEVTLRLRKVVDIVDASQGTVKLRSGDQRAAELELDMGGTRTVRRGSRIF